MLGTTAGDPVEEEDVLTYLRGKMNGNSANLELACLSVVYQYYYGRSRTGGLPIQLAAPRPGWTERRQLHIGPSQRYLHHRRVESDATDS